MMNRVGPGVIIILVFVLVSAAYANPIIIPDPLNLFAFAVVLGSAIAIETGIVTLILMFWGIEAKPVYAALAAGNLVLYLAAFLPLLKATDNIWLAEIIIVVLDGILIKVLTLFDTFCGNTFRPLRWPYAFVIAAVGNIVSYYVGAAIAG